MTACMKTETYVFFCLTHEQQTHSHYLSLPPTHTHTTQSCTWKPVRGDVMFSKMMNESDFLWDLQFKTVLRKFNVLFPFQGSKVTKIEWAGTQLVSINMEEPVQATSFKWPELKLYRWQHWQLVNQHFYVCTSTTTEMLLNADRISGAKTGPPTTWWCLHA